MKLFIACICFLVAPTVLFITTLRDYNAILPCFLIPRPTFMKDGTLLWLSVTQGNHNKPTIIIISFININTINTGGSPLYHGKKLKLSLQEHDTLLKVIYFIVLWALVLVAQIGCLLAYTLLYLPYFAVHLPLWTFWFLFGAYLMQIKMLSVGNTYNTTTALTLNLLMLLLLLLTL